MLLNAMFQALKSTSWQCAEISVDGTMQKACHPHLKVFTNQIIINQIIIISKLLRQMVACGLGVPQPSMPPNVQSVRRSDILVEEHCGLVTYAIIKECLSLENLSTQFT